MVESSKRIISINKNEKENVIQLTLPAKINSNMIE